MQPLPTQFEQGNFRYTQIERDGDLAIFEQRHKDHTGMVRYEVIRVRIQAEHTWPNGTTTPEKEAYPGSSSWGRDGFTHFTLPQAQAHFTILQDTRTPQLAVAEEEMPDVQ